MSSQSQTQLNLMLERVPHETKDPSIKSTLGVRPISIRVIIATTVEISNSETLDLSKHTSDVSCDSQDRQLPEE